MQKGTTVTYNDEEYVVLWIYNNGYCEIQKDLFTVELVKLSEIDNIQETLNG
ncbi:hypothetical protein [Pseudalkalibacillus caeni]|uniref:hypothetical protein n=1 Tax=Exobacillus caeni TaxID=2574798 RepID=UPI00148536FF|nr:hypothetical protein [Pseudalkalibacillus caeni]